MTSHQKMLHLDGSISERIYAGGRWSVRRGPAGGGESTTGGIIDCDAQRFVDDQNRAVRDFHRDAVRGYVGAGEAA